jgi:hypothetical protein
VFFKKAAQIKRRPIDRNSPNLVTLTLGHLVAHLISLCTKLLVCLTRLSIYAVGDWFELSNFLLL